MDICSQTIWFKSHFRHKWHAFCLSLKAVIFNSVVMFCWSLISCFIYLWTTVSASKVACHDIIRIMYALLHICQAVLVRSSLLCPFPKEKSLPVASDQKLRERIERWQENGWKLEHLNGKYVCHDRPEECHCILLARRDGPFFFLPLNAPPPQPTNQPAIHPPTQPALHVPTHNRSKLSLSPPNQSQACFHSNELAQRRH